MQLLSPSNSIHDATFASSDGSISYSFQTSGWPSRKTQISKLGRALGKVQLHSYSLDEVIVNDREIKVEKTGMMSSERYFQAFNNQTYTWKASHKAAQLKDSQNRTIAIFEKGSSGFFSKSRPATLEIMDAGVPIVDEIFATFLYTLQKVRQKNSNAAAVAGAASG